MDISAIRGVSKMDIPTIKPKGDTKMKNEDKYEAFFSYGKDNYTSRVNADNLLALEKGVKQNLESIQERLSQNYSHDDNRSIREVLELEAKGM